MQRFVAWCQARSYIPDTTSFPLLEAFLDSLEKSNAPMRVITGMGPALQYAHEANLTAGECAASSEAFSQAVADIKRSVPITIDQPYIIPLPPTYAGSAPGAESSPLQAHPSVTSNLANT